MFDSLSFQDSISVSNEEIVSTIKRCYDENRYRLCPHSAVGVRYHYDNPDRSVLGNESHK